MNDTEKTSTTPESAGSKKRPPAKGRGLIVIAVFIMAFIIFGRRESVDTIDCTPDIIASKPDVIMLGAWWCTYCYQAKRYFQQNQIHYCEYDMENTEIGKQLYKEHGSGAIPILIIGDYQVDGFSERQIDKALSLLESKAEK